MPDVIDCSIEGVYDEILGETMKATVIIKEQVEITADAIKAWCVARLASYKVPQFIDIRDKMTISATGKKIKK